MQSPSFHLKRNMFIDLHCHSRYSDGSLTVEEILEESKKINLEHLSITDHDCLQGSLDARLIRDKYNFNIIPGIELSCFDYVNNRKVHILGYNIDLLDSELLEHELLMRKKRNRIAINIINELRSKGYEIAIDNFNESLTKYKILYKQEIFTFLKKKYNIQGKRLNKLMMKENIAIQNIEYITYKKGIELILKSGGIPVIAHVGVYNNWDLMEELIDLGIKGIEVFHHQHSEKECARALKIAEKYDLYVTGGSDFHGEYRDKKSGAKALGVEVKNDITRFF